jgi:hypothetical protein
MDEVIKITTAIITSLIIMLAGIWVGYRVVGKNDENFDTIATHNPNYEFGHWMRKQKMERGVLIAMGSVWAIGIYLILSMDVK